MNLQSKNIVLRAPEPSDIDILYRWENDTEIWHVSNTNAPYSRFVIEQFVLNSSPDIFASRQVRLMIDLKTGNKRTIGAVDLFDFDALNRRAGIGILICSEFREKGYASETLEIVEKYAAEFLNIHQIYCNISEDNVLSIKLFKKAGYINTGIKKDWVLLNNKWVNELFFQKIINNV